MPIKVKVRVANVLIVGFLLEEETPSLILGDCSGHLASLSVVIIDNISIIMTIITLIKIIPLSFSAQEQQTMPSLIRRTRRKAGPKSQSPDCQVLVARKGHRPG